MKKRKTLTAITDKQRIAFLLEEYSPHVVMLSFYGGDTYKVVRCVEELDAAIKASRKVGK